MLTSHPSFGTIGESIKESCQFLHRLSHQSLDYKDSRLFAVLLKVVDKQVTRFTFSMITLYNTGTLICINSCLTNALMYNS